MAVKFYHAHLAVVYQAFGKKSSMSFFSSPIFSFHPIPTHILNPILPLSLLIHPFPKAGTCEELSQATCEDHPCWQTACYPPHLQVTRHWAPLSILRLHSVDTARPKWQYAALWVPNWLKVPLFTNTCTSHVTHTHVHWGLISRLVILTSLYVPYCTHPMH